MVSANLARAMAEENRIPLKLSWSFDPVRNDKQFSILRKSIVRRKTLFCHQQAQLRYKLNYFTFTFMHRLPIYLPRLLRFASLSHSIFNSIRDGERSRCE